MKATLNDIGTFKEVLLLNKGIIDNLVLMFDKEGMHYRALDRSHICFVMADVDKEFFIEYECSKPVNVVVDMDMLSTILKRIGKDGELTVYDDVGHFYLEYKGASDKVFNVALIDEDYSDMTPPALDFPVECQVSYKEWMSSLKDAGIYSDKVHIDIGREDVVLSIDGVEGGYKSKLSSYDTVELPEKREYYHSGYNISRLLNYNVKFTDELDIRMGEETPIVLTSKTLDELVRTSMMLAPIIEAD